MVEKTISKEEAFQYSMSNFSRSLADHEGSSRHKRNKSYFLQPNCVTHAYQNQEFNTEIVNYQ